MTGMFSKIKTKTNFLEIFDMKTHLNSIILFGNFEDGIRVIAYETNFRNWKNINIRNDLEADISANDALFMSYLQNDRIIVFKTIFQNIINN